MPMYNVREEMNLKQYLSKLNGVVRIQKILEVAYKQADWNSQVRAHYQTDLDLQ